MSEVKAISFGFENCEGCEIPIEYVWYFSVENVTKLKSYHCSNGIREYSVANKLSVQFEQKFYGYVEKSDFGDLVIERICKYNDICWFNILYVDGSQEKYMVKWQVDDQYTNPGQKVTQEEYGLLLEIN